MMKPGNWSFARSPVRWTSRAREEATKASPHSASRICSWSLRNPHGQPAGQADRTPWRSGARPGATGCHAPFEVDLESPRTMSAAACRRGGPPAGSRFDAGEELNQLHGLDEVVVRSGPQAEHHAAFVVARCQDQDRDGVTWRSFRRTSRPSMSGSPRSSRITPNFRWTRRASAPRATRVGGGRRLPPRRRARKPWRRRPRRSAIPWHGPFSSAGTSRSARFGDYPQAPGET